MSKYNEAQIGAIVSHLTDKIKDGEYDTRIAAVMVLSMAKAGRVESEDIVTILIKVLGGNLEAVVSVLADVSKGIDGDDIEEVAALAQRMIKGSKNKPDSGSPSV
ncbi:hypothetical protein [Paenibacillus sp. NPDC058071]|uniref:hypothetical protein n=1 Tax=Paenibacillus sp. NPDC058071 TaxID=3346326 RepID=UPI0036DC9E18